MYGKSARLIRYVLVVTALLYAGLGNAALVVDQEQTISSNDQGFAILVGTKDVDLILKQSFMQSQGNIAGAGLFLTPRTGGNGDITIALLDDTMTLKRSGTLAVDTTSSDWDPDDDGEWVDVFWAPLVASLTDTFYLRFTSGVTGESGFLAGAALNGSPNSDQYIKGIATIGSTKYDGTAEPFRDVTFRTYYDNDLSAVPVPAAAWLFGTALIGFIGFSRRTTV
jgi:hypothetical protein